MNIKALLPAFLLASFGLVAPAHAWKGPTVEYSADSYFETAEATMDGKLYYAPGKEVREYNQDGQKMISIMRHDKKVMWMLMPEDKSYMEMKIPKEGRPGDMSAYDIKQTNIGPETVNGIKTTKSKIIMTGPKGVKLGGFYWTTREGIVVKVDAIAIDKKSKARIKQELKNLKVGKLNPSVFDIPAGYTRMSMGLGAMMGGGGKDDDGGQPQQKEKKKGFGLGDAINLMK
jgi:hypothetical protein